MIVSVHDWECSSLRVVVIIHPIGQITKIHIIILYTYIHDYVYTVNIKQLQTLQFSQTKNWTNGTFQKKPSENQGTKQHPPKPWWTSQYTTLEVSPLHLPQMFVGRNTKNCFLPFLIFGKKTAYLFNLFFGKKNTTKKTTFFFFMGEIPSLKLT